MSWLARSLSTSLRLDQNDVAPDPPSTSPQNHQHQHHHHQSQEPQDSEESESEEEESELQGRGVKEDFDEIKQTLTRQFWGVASFLAPPPPPTDDNGECDPHVSSSEHRRTRSDPDWNQSEPSDPSSASGNEERQDGVVSGIQDPDLVPDGSGSEPEEEEHDFENAVGITEEVFAFATNIAMHPETWLDFPIDEEEDTDDFEISEAQREHAFAIERLAPRLAALRIELCPCHMSEGYFWKVYFVLLHSRLNKRDAEILSTPQVMAARAMWMQELQKQMKPEFECFGRTTSYARDTAPHDSCGPSLLGDAYAGARPHGYEISTLSMTTDYKTEELTVESSAHFIGKSVIEEKTMIETEDKDQRCGRASQIILQDCEDDDDDWPEEDSDLGGYGRTTISVVNEEEISFSDLDDDDYDINPISSNKNSKVV